MFKCLKDSGIKAFFTRSSAANITINMGGVAITISVLALAAVHNLGIQVDIGMILLLSLLSTVSACGDSSVAGGSLLLVPLACSLLSIPNDVAMQVVGVGFIVGFTQDSCEIALNSSTNVLFTDVAEFSKRRR